jgi:protein SCO1
MKTLKVFLIAIVIAGSLGAFSYLSPKSNVEGKADSQSATRLPVLATVPQFSLQSDSGETITSDALKGKSYLMMFFFTSCQGICPAINSNVKKLLSELSTDSLPTIVAISVDPERDTVEKLKAYREELALPMSWKLISVEEAEVERIMTGVKLVSGEDPSLHSTRVVFVDSEGQVKKFAEGRDVDSLMELKELL